jgi:electron transfer flavoprotein alpha subunit
MANVLIVAEQHAGALRKATLHAVGAGRELAVRTGGKLTLLLAGRGVAALGEELRGYGDVLLADAPALEHYVAEAYAPVVADAAKACGAAFVGAAASAFGKDLLPRAASRLGAAMATEVLSFGGDGADVTFRRPMWAGNVLAEVELATPVKVFTVRATEFAPAAKAAAPGALTALAVSAEAAPRRTRFV